MLLNSNKYSMSLKCIIYFMNLDNFADMYFLQNIYAGFLFFLMNNISSVGADQIPNTNNIGASSQYTFVNVKSSPYVKATKTKIVDR